MCYSAAHHPLVTENRSPETDHFRFPFLSAKSSPSMTSVQLRHFLQYNFISLLTCPIFPLLYLLTYSFPYLNYPEIFKLSSKASFKDFLQWKYIRILFLEFSSEWECFLLYITCYKYMYYIFGFSFV